MGDVVQARPIQNHMNKSIVNDWAQGYTERADTNSKD